MSQEIAVVGSPEFTTGFRLAGVRHFENVEEPDKPDALDDAVERAMETEDVGIVVMHHDDLDYLSRDARDAVETSIDPTVVVLGSEAQAGLREQIKRAIGIDLLAEDTT